MHQGAASTKSLLQPVPASEERPTLFADRVGAWHTNQISKKRRKDLGIYFSPVVIADFMAGFLERSNSSVRILDPGAGSGVLCCAAIEHLAKSCPECKEVELDAYEIDESLAELLYATLTYLKNWSKLNYDVKVSFNILNRDFILDQAKALQISKGLFRPEKMPDFYDAVIANPPYFKINKNDPRALAAHAVVHGQPNIYSLFMAVGASLLRDQGDFIFITPRSFSSGLYFRRFREYLFQLVQPKSVHVIGSRRKAFVRDNVLQENIIMHGKRIASSTKPKKDDQLIISTSKGINDIKNRTVIKVPLSLATRSNSKEKFLRLPITEEEKNILDLVDNWPCNLQSLGLKISTGPVVPFRARKFIKEEGSRVESDLPLIWMNHVKSMRFTWPLDGGKPQFISNSATQLLVPNDNYILLRRFSSKEQPRRLTAAPYISDELDCPSVGIENHVNYIHRPGGKISQAEAYGLAALYNSRILDTYFRTVNGNTQVNATEIRSIPLPDAQTITAIGRNFRKCSKQNQLIDDFLTMSMPDNDLGRV